MAGEYAMAEVAECPIRVWRK